ncbi:hypothetical protein EVB88_004 [Rhizobium phage RHph_N28_2]|nr:hypothetical protein EVB88_004 [Rhizobium phage RHph_N28_2]
MDSEQLKAMRERYQAEIRHAEEMIDYIEKYHFVSEAWTTADQMRT